DGGGVGGGIGPRLVRAEMLGDPRRVGQAESVPVACGGRDGDDLEQGDRDSTTQSWDRERGGGVRQDRTCFQLFEPQEGSIPFRNTAASAPEGASLKNASHGDLLR